MITLEEYVGPHANSPDWTPERQAKSIKLLAASAALEAEMVADGINFPINPATKSGVSGQTLGGFRPQASTTGAPNSAHKDGEAVDRYDPKGEIAKWCMAHQDRLKAHGIYMEHPSATKGWCHWGIRRPGSGNTVFYP